MASNLSDGELLEAIRKIRLGQPGLGRAKIRQILKEEHQWQVSEDRLKKLIRAINDEGQSAAGGSGIPRSEDSSPPLPQLSGFHFWVNQAHKNADARSLATSLGLDLPRGNPMGYKAGLMYPMRRLVVTGQDNPDNFRILFGIDSVPDTHAEARKMVLMSGSAEHGSPNQMLGGYLDEGCPYWAPRPPNEEEREVIRKQEEFGRRFARMMEEANAA